jgi:predicted permease
MGTLVMDLKYALRSLGRAKGVTLVTAMTIAVGLGATTTIFSVANALLFRPPAGIPDARPLVTVHSIDPDDGSSFHAFSYLDYRDLAAHPPGLSGLAAFAVTPTSLSTGEEPELQLGMLVSWNYFRTLGVTPALGRFFVPEEDAGPGGPRVLVVGYTEWQRRFRGDPAVIGRPVRLNGESFTIIGVAPPGFRGHTAGFDVTLWVPVSLDDVLSNGSRRLGSRNQSFLELVGRLDGSLGAGAVASALSAAHTSIAQAHGESGQQLVDVLAFSPLPAQAALPAAEFIALLLLLAIFVLLIAASNVANVLLGRASARSREIAVRLAIGAGRARLVRLLVTESLVLFAMGGAGGTLLAWWATNVLSLLRPPIGIPIALDFSMDMRVHLFTTAVTLLTGIVFGLAPALQTSRIDVVAALKDEPSSARVGRFRLRGAFVAAQIAGTTLLLVVAGLFARSLARAGTQDLGFEPAGVQTLSFMMEVRAGQVQEARRFAEALADRAAGLPGVLSVATTDFLPLNLGNQKTLAAVPGREPKPGAGWFNPDYTCVSPGYFATMRIPILRGRAFESADRAGSPSVAILNEALARQMWPGEDPLGRTILFGSLREGVPTTVVGIARDAKYRSAGEEPVPMIYVPFDQDAGRSFALLVRTAPGAADPIPALREAVRALDPALPIARIASLEQVVATATIPNRAAVALASMFGMAGLLLASVGLYAVLSFMVTRRRKEIGIRMALGATGADVGGLILHQGFRLVGAGLLAGFAGAAGLSYLLRSLLFGLHPLDPVTYSGIALVLGLSGLAACLLPARRALRTQPIEVLRHD